MSQQNESGRNENGQFAKGNRFGKGNPFARQVAQLRKALVDAFSEEDIAEIAQKLKQMCLEGNLAAIKIVFSYLLGKPDAPVDPDTLDLKEWQIREQEPTSATSASVKASARRANRHQTVISVSVAASARRATSVKASARRARANRHQTVISASVAASARRVTSVAA
ncbi:MAG: hypothetical protein KatS3mg105_2573 [Gemmatales bacterium]|nr:MAG: hypothetical protein KatS3mg105_2573 [Gemmatales bacterium]